MTAACPRAQALWLLPGLSLADARARVPQLRVHEAEPQADAQLLLLLARQSARWSPMVAPDPPDGLLIDISGCAHLFGGETALAADVAARLGARLEVRHAFASTPSAAQALARFPQRVADETEAIRRLPVSALRLAAKDEIALRRAGLKRIADLADRPTAPLSARFGEGTTAALNRLLGRDDSRIVPLRSLPALHFARRFAEPEQLTGAIMSRRQLDLSYPAAEAAAHLLWDSAAINNRGYVRSAARFLPYVMGQKGPSASALVTAAFPPVYRELQKESLPDFLSFVFMFLDWDRCKIARRELGQAALHSRWRPRDVALAAARAGDADRILRHISKREGGRAFITSVSNDITSIPEPSKKQVWRAIKSITAEDGQKNRLPFDL